MPSTWERRWGEPNFLRRNCVPMTRGERETVSPVEGRQEWDIGLEAKVMKCTLYLEYRMQYHYHYYTPHTHNSTSHSTHSQLHITLHTLTTPHHTPHTHNSTSHSTHSQLHITLHTLTTPHHTPHTHNSTLHSTHSQFHITLHTPTTPHHTPHTHNSTSHSTHSQLHHPHPHPWQGTENWRVQREMTWRKIGGVGREGGRENTLPRPPPPRWTLHMQ